MGLGDNNVLIAVSLVERARVSAKEEARVQLNRLALANIKMSVWQALEKVGNVDDVNLLTHIVGIVKFIETLLEDENYLETDTNAKDSLNSKLRELQGQIYIYAGQYYERKDFKYTMQMDPLLERVIDHCMNQKMYFGLDKIIREEEGEYGHL